MEREVYTASANSNIALVKYWGKKEDNLPLNSSVSMTLDRNVSTATSIVFSKKFNNDKIYINGFEVQNLSENKKSHKLFEILDQMKKLAGTSSNAIVVSKNNFPTSAGMASSASGAAALVYAANAALELNLSSKELSIFARKISGSGSRSMFGGFVIWHASDKSEESYAEPICGENHWPGIVDLIALISSGEKKISSRQGHVITTNTSSLYSLRPRIAEEHVNKAIHFIINRDAHGLFDLIMRESNNMHAVMLDSFPPIHYINDLSWLVIEKVQEVNSSYGKNISAYTLDAGPNVHIITEDRYLSEIKKAVREAVPSISFIEAHAGGAPILLDKDESLISEDILKGV
ncbi:MAG: diphosphomevalonate decarboxylase [Candidatus Micrarchaeia archaeon]